MIRGIHVDLENFTFQLPKLNNRAKFLVYISAPDYRLKDLKTDALINEDDEDSNVLLSHNIGKMPSLSIRGTLSNPYSKFEDDFAKITKSEFEIRGEFGHVVPKLEGEQLDEFANFVLKFKDEETESKYIEKNIY